VGGIARWRWRGSRGKWIGRDSEAALVEGCEAEVGLHYRDKSSSMWGVMQT